MSQTLATAQAGLRKYRDAAGQMGKLDKRISAARTKLNRLTRQAETTESKIVHTHINLRLLIGASCIGLDQDHTCLALSLSFSAANHVTRSTLLCLA